MSKHSFEEMMVGSTQQSLLTGAAGFGVRTMSQGISVHLASGLFQRLTTLYEVPVNRQVGGRQLRDDPAVTTRYPRTYRQQTCEVDGERWYAASAATYVGIDYGYFCGKDSACRAGSNYLTHVVLSRKPIPAALWTVAARGALFVPCDNTCRPDNPELRRWLCGEPQLLPVRVVELPSAQEALEALDATGRALLCALLKGLLQVKVNRGRGGGGALVVLVPEALTPRVLEALGAMPDAVTGMLTFETNCLSVRGLPAGADLVMVNEHNDRPPVGQGAVVVDFEDGQLRLRGVEDHAVMHRLDALAQGDGVAEALELAGWLYGAPLRSMDDLEAAERAFAIIRRRRADVAGLTPELLERMAAMLTCDADRATLRTETDRALNQCLADAADDRVAEALAFVKPFVEKGLFRPSMAVRRRLTDWLSSGVGCETPADICGRLGQDYVAQCLLPDFDLQSLLPAPEASAEPSAPEPRTEATVKSSVWGRLTALLRGKDKKQ